jgi:iron-sulfur cluster assembly accessory protein
MGLFSRIYPSHVASSAAGEYCSLSSTTQYLDQAMLILWERQIMSTETVSTETTAVGILLTDVAASKVSALLAQEGRDDLYLRVAVQPGGCSGLKYQLYFDDRNQDGDVSRSFGSVRVVTDKMSDPYLAGATIDFVDTIEKQGFTIDNPNAAGSCACGDSFN